MWILSKKVSENLGHEVNFLIPTTRSMTLGPLSFSGTVVQASHTNEEDAQNYDISLKW
jgi:hypothetical protein